MYGSGRGHRHLGKYSNQDLKAVATIQIHSKLSNKIQVFFRKALIEVSKTLAEAVLNYGKSMLQQKANRVVRAYTI